ncbi:MAG TPA: PQQ-dependent sugar dehydrogenase [Thermoleophilaceae bacterium]|nr:PQQ-dependent sugar dehydrogenase [Thermoleophilaceae bacterium]
MLALLAVSAVPSGALASPRLVSVGNFSEPIYVTAPPEDSHRLFVVERAGRVRLLKGGTALSEPFLDISADVEIGGEGGLISVAFPPDYAATGRFYALYTDSVGIRVVEVRRSQSTPDRADPASRRILLTLPHTDSRYHYAGQLQFGPDGQLYISTGDGGPQEDPHGRAQDLGSLWGKILRIDPRSSASEPYSIPADNPFVGTAGARPEIWSYGLRNPFRFSFDRTTGALTIGDVGYDASEGSTLRRPALGAVLAPTSAGTASRHGRPRSLEAAHPLTRCRRRSGCLTRARCAR